MATTVYQLFTHTHTKYFLFFRTICLDFLLGWLTNILKKLEIEKEDIARLNRRIFFVLVVRIDDLTSRAILNLKRGTHFELKHVIGKHNNKLNLNYS